MKQIYLSIARPLLSSKTFIKSKCILYALSMMMCMGSMLSYGQMNVALTAVADHGGPGASGAGVYAPSNYNDGIIAAVTGCTDAVTPWGWVDETGWITYTWSAPVTFDKIVFYKSNRTMASCTLEYWNGTLFVPFLSYASTICPDDSVTFPPVTTTILRLNNISSGAASDNPNHREIQVWSTPTTPCVTPSAQPTALLFTPGVYNVTGSFTAATGSPERYLTIMTTTSTPPSAPVDGTSYGIGSTALGGTVVANGTATSFSATGLTPATQYWFWIYSYNAFCIGGPLYLAASPLSGTILTNVCSVSGTRVVGPTGSYPTIAAAMTALSNNGLAGPVILEIQTTYTGEALPITIDANIPCLSATNNITIRPQGTLTLAGPAGADMIILNGAKYITIDGRVGSTGTTKALTLANTSATGSVIRFINGASDNTIKYCKLLGENTNVDNANVLFSTSTAATGNINNTVDNCDIMDDGIGTPLYCVFSEGTAGKENTGNTISNCNIANFFNAATASRGVFFSTATTNCTINNNRFYQTAPRTYTAAVTHCPIAVVNTTGNAFTVTNNIIGFSSSAGTGTYTMSSATTTAFQGILMTVDDITASTVQGNTVTALNYSTTSGAMSGIAVSAGRVNVIGNTIGATTGTGSIVKTNSTTSSPAFMGISTTAATPGVVNIQNNNIGSITTNGSTATIGAGVYGISATSTATTTITGNVIGSTTTANSINSATVSTGTQLVYGIIATITSSTLAPPLISGNTIANINAAGTGTASLTAGILFNSTSSGVITNNLIRNISSSSANTVLTGQMGVSGIAYTGTTGSATISQNTINTLIATNTAAVVSNVAGIAYTGSVDGIVTRNRIYDLRNMSTGVTATTPPKAIGINCYNPTGEATISNNMISLGNAQTTNTAFTGIMQGTTSSTAIIRIYNNTVNIEGTAASGALPSAGLLRGNYSATAYTTTFDIQNNIFNNTRTGGTGKHYAIANGINGTASITGWPLFASNYNILNAAAATVGFWTTDQTFANWKTNSGSDANSYTATPLTFINAAAGDLHLNMGVTPNNIESHGTLIGVVTNDYDGQVRPGPAGSVNGGAFSHDIGADEIDGVPNENIAPIISYSVLGNACGTGNRTFTANIVDQSGVPLAGTRPKVYYKKGVGGTWFSNSGTLSSGTATNGIWSFTILSTDMGGLAVGDQVYYYVIAQDVPGNIGSMPLGVSATNVNTVTTPPPAPNSYTTIQALGGAYNVGLSGTYTTITSAVNAYNNFCLSGPVTFNLTDATYPTETFPITINANAFSSSFNTLTIKPAPGASPSITGSGLPGIFVLNGADYVIIDGSNNPVTNSVCPPVASSRDMTITNTSTSTASAVIWLQSTTAPDGATNNIIRNCNIYGSSNVQTLFGIGSGSTTVSTTSVGNGNSFNRIENNNINACQNGIYTRGATALNKNQGNIINQNVIAGSAPANNMTDNGILTGFENNIIISGNQVANIANTAAQDLIGISVGATSNGVLATSLTNAEVTNATVTYNKLDNITTPATASSAIGICVSGPGSGTTTIANNMISNIGGKQTGSDLAAGIYVFATIAGGTTDILYNTVKLSGTFPGGTVGSFGFAVNGANPTVNIKGNIFVNELLNGSLFRYAIGVGYTGATALTSNYNDFFITGGNLGVVGSLTTAGTQSPTLAAWQTNTGYDLNSKNVNPVFVSSTDLHAAPVLQNAGFMNAGVPLSITTDMDCAVRSSSTPDIGADEFNVPNCSVPSAGIATAGGSAFCNAGVTTINAVGPTAGIGSTYQWQSSTDSVSWTAISGATTTSYTIPTPITATTFYRIKVGCTLTSTYDSSTAKVTIIPNPSNITGQSLMCINSTYALASATTGGTWSSSSPGIAAVNATGTITTGAGPGSANISYTMGNGCSAIKNVIVSDAAPLVTAAATPAVICAGESSSLTGTTTNPGSSSYAINSISYAAESFTPIGTFTSVSVVSGGNLDDGFFTVTLPFDFEYYGTTYPAGSNAYIGINGFMTFGTGWSAASFIGVIPNLTYPATISLLGVDMELTYSGSITYGVTGTAPNRHFIVSYNGVPDWRNDVPNTYLESGQIILHETSNNIELHVGTLLGVDIHSIGIQSNAGAQSSTVTGQNNIASTVYATAWQFTTKPLAYSWVANPTLSATNTLTPTTTALTASNTYTLNVTASNGCSASAETTVTVNPLPAAIAGATQVCEGYTITLTNADAGGTWSSDNTGVAGINAATGVLTGVSAGTANISYTFAGTGCRRATVVTVNATPAAIGGIAQMCEAAATTLTNANAGGTWASSSPSVATIDAGTGMVSGIVAGTSLITYTLPTGCKRTIIATVNAQPHLSVSPATPATLCLGNSTSAYTAIATSSDFTLLTQDFNDGMGGWSVNGTGLPSSLWQIVPSPGADGAIGDGSAMIQSNANFNAVNNFLISPSFSTVDFAAAVLTFNQYLVSDGSDPAILVQYSTDGGSAWTTLDDYTSSGIIGSGSWIPASPETTLPLPAGALGEPDVRIRWVYHASSFSWSLDNIKVKATLPPATYTWTGGSDLSCTICDNPAITPSVTGTSVYTVVATGSGNCTAETSVTINVNPLPAVITGTPLVCEGSTATLSNADAGGTWTSGSTSATINANTGVMLGVSAGNPMITYMLPTGCIRTVEATVNPLPDIIAGSPAVCEGLTTSLTNATAAGTWTSSAPAVASIGSASGIVDGLSPGTASISYVLGTGCLRAINFTVHPTPAIITGTQEVCEGLTTTLSNADAGGTWTSGTPTAAAIDVNTGVVTGVLAGTSMITYMLPTGCIRSTEATVNAIPALITGTLDVCEGLTTTLSNSTPEGTWTSGTPTAATIDAGTGTVTAVQAGNSMITYMLATGCIRTAEATVNPLPALIAGTQEVCEGLTTTLSNADAGGTWTSATPTVAAIDANTGVVTGVLAGNSMITYMLPTGCMRSTEATVNAVPAAISGTPEVCEGLTTTLSDATTGGTWISGAPTVAAIDANTGMVTGVLAGNAIVTYRLPTGCISTENVTVNPLPAVITGTRDVCVGLTTTLSNADGGGTWTSSNPTAAAIDANTGVVTGMLASTSMITYMLPTGCIRSAEATVNALPAAITGTPEVCEGLTTTFNSVTPGGTWTSGTPTVATIDINTGVLTGVLAGTSTVTYMLSTGCIRTEQSTVNPLPAAIAGIQEVCEGLTTTLTNASPGGNWTSGTATVATIDAASGVVTGVAAGNAMITYTLPTGCIRATEATVHATPAAITGTTQVCEAASTALADATAGGAWSSNNTTVATIGTSGIVSGLAAGTATIIYTLPNSCTIATNVTVNALPVVYNVTGGGNYCAGGSGMHIGTNNSEAGYTYTLYNGSVLAGTHLSSGGILDFGTYTASGTYTVQATSPASCASNMSGNATVTIIPVVIPAVTLASAPGDSVCVGTNAVFTATPVNGGAIPAYTWTVNGSLMTSTVNSYNYTPADGDVVKVTLTSSEACTAPATVSASITMEVLPYEIPFASIAVGPNDSLCQGIPATFSAISAFGGSAPVYSWYKNTVPTGITGATYSYVPVNGDVIRAELNSNYRCLITNNVSSGSIVMHIDSNYLPVVTIDVSTGTSIQPGQSVTFTAKVTDGGPSPTYQWIKNSTPISGATNEQYTTNNLVNNDSISCNVRGTGPCAFHTFNSVRMKVTTGFEQPVADGSNIRMMPNPNMGEFVVNGTVNAAGDTEVWLEVTDMLGQVVYKSNATAKASNLNERVKLNNTLANGMYILNVRTGTENKVFHFVLKN